MIRAENTSRMANRLAAFAVAHPIGHARWQRVHLKCTGK